MRMPALLSRKPVSQPAQQRMTTKTFPAPIRGLVTNESLAAGASGGAMVLDNFFPTQRGIRIRRGAGLHATVKYAPVKSFLVYRSGSFEKMFACSSGAIYDVSSPSSSSIPPVALVTGRTSNYYSHVQFANAGGEFMIAVNGTDLHLVYDGSSFAANTPAITGVSSATFSQVWSYKNRLFFVKKGSKSAYYLSVDSIGGVATEFSLAGVFKRGGSLLLGATWSLDAGDGLDDKCVFISTTGEVAVYQGSNPSDIADWAIVGRYDFASPLSINSTMQAGGDLLVCTTEGLIPISEAVNKDPAALAVSAISRPIENLWKEIALDRTSSPIEIVKWPEQNMAIISAPSDIAVVSGESRWGFGVWGDFRYGGGNVLKATQELFCYVVNLQTGAWARYTGWDVQCLAYFKGGVYFGTSNGRIMQAEVGGSDNGRAYVSRYAGLFQRISGAAISHLMQARATWVYSQNFTDRVSFSTGYELKWPVAPNSAQTVTEAFTWDVSNWDEGIWGAETSEKIKSRWVSIGLNGFAVSPNVQVTSQSDAIPQAELISVDLTCESGGVVV